MMENDECGMTNGGEREDGGLRMEDGGEYPGERRDRDIAPYRHAAKRTAFVNNSVTES